MLDRGPYPRYQDTVGRGWTLTTFETQWRICTVERQAQAHSQTTPIGGRVKILGDKSYWSPYSTNHRNHWQRHYYDNGPLPNNAASEVSRNFFGLYTPNCDILGYISRKWSQKKFKWICLGGKTVVWWGQLRAITPVPLPDYVTGTSDLDFTLSNLNSSYGSQPLSRGLCYGSNQKRYDHGRDGERVLAAFLNVIRAVQHNLLDCSEWSAKTRYVIFASSLAISR